MLTQYKNSQYTLSMNEVNRLIGAPFNFRNRMIIETLYFTAMRREEITNIDIRDIDFDTGRIKVIGKGNKLAVIPVGSAYPQYMINLKTFVGKRTSGWLFLNNRKQKMSLSMINQIVAQAGKLAHLKNPNPRLKYINPHMLRHTQVKHLKDLGVSIEIIQDYVRHSNVTTTMQQYGRNSISENEEHLKQKLIGMGDMR